MWVLMRERFAVPEPAAVVKRALDVRVRIENPLPAEKFDGIEEVSAGTDRRVDLEAVLPAGQKIVSAMAWRGMDRARALFKGDVVGKNRDGVAFVQRVTEFQSFEGLPLHPGERPIEGPL